MYRTIAIIVLVIFTGTRSGLSIAETTIRVGLALPEEMKQLTFVNGMYELFKEEVETHSDGRLNVKIYYGGVLGKPDDRLNQMRRNIIQMSDASDGNYATIHRDIQVFSMPYLFPDIDTARQVLDGPIGKLMAQDILKETGIRVLGWWETGGFRQYSSNQPIYSPEDMHGQKIRVMGAIFTKPVSAMGGAPIPIPMPELYISLKTGLVDGQDNAVAVFNMLDLYEVQKYITLDNHIYGFAPFGINNEFFTSLEKKDQQIIRDAATKAVAWNREQARIQEQKALRTAESKGVTIIRLSDEERSEFARLALPVAAEWLRETIDTPSLVDDVLVAANKLSEADQ